MSRKKKRKPQAQPVATQRERVENGIVASHEQPATLARKATVTDISPQWASDVGFELGQALAGEGVNLSGDQVLKAVRSTMPMHNPNGDRKLPKLPNRMTDDQVDRIIREHPQVAMEGLAKLGRVMKVPDSEIVVPHFNGMELKARVAHDLRTGRYDNSVVAKRSPNTAGVYAGMTSDILGDATVIDVQSVYQRWMDAGQGNDMYELQLAPPWFNALMLYHNSTGNVWAMHMVGSDIRAENWSQSYLDEIAWQPQTPADHVIEWDQVRWVYSVQVYLGGMGAATPRQTVGPLMVWRIAVYEDGVPADIHWTHIVPSVPIHKFNNALGAMTETINMCNCVNVHVAESERRLPRAQRRRLERYGVTFSEVHIKPASKSYKGRGTPLSDMGTALHGVRGHYATYGKDGRGLLFGKHSGRFWIPQHVRGSRDNGEIAQSYVTET